MNTFPSSRNIVMWLKRVLFGFLILLIALPLIGAGFQFTATQLDKRNFPAHGLMVDVGGYELHLHCIGTGSPTIIMEGGFGGTSLDWSLVQPELAKETRVCAYDRAGLGWSEIHPDDLPRTSQQIASELHTLLAKADIPAPYILVGLSAGGMHTQMYASQYPEDVHGLVLVDPTPAQFMADLASEDRQALLPNLEQFRLLQKLEPFGLMRLVSLPGSEALTKLPVEIQQEIRAVNVKTGIAQALYAEAAGIEASILQTASLRSLPAQVPVTVLWHGIPSEPIELEPLAEASLRDWVNRLGDGRFIIAENSGHHIAFDRPDMVIAEVRAMLKIIRHDY